MLKCDLLRYSHRLFAERRFSDVGYLGSESLAYLTSFLKVRLWVHPHKFPKVFHHCIAKSSIHWVTAHSCTQEVYCIWTQLSFRRFAFWSKGSRCLPNHFLSIEIISMSIMCQIFCTEKWLGVHFFYWHFPIYTKKVFGSSSSSWSYFNGSYA